VTKGLRAPRGASSPGEPEWFAKWFGEDYLTVYPHRDGKEADEVIGFLHSRFAGRRIDRVLDLACGSGRHSRALGKRWWTTGLDLSEALLAVARREAKDACYVRGDMRILPFRPASFSLVVNLFTSFGYFSEEEVHRQVLREVNEAMEPGGAFVLDYLNAEQVVRTLSPSDERIVNGVVVEQSRRVTADGRFVEKRITMRGKGKSFIERVRLFSRDDLEQLLGESGFEVEEVFGDYSGSPWTPASERAMFVSTKR